MANKDNLIPLNERTQRERKQIATMGAIASNKVQKEKKLIRQALEEKLNMRFDEYINVIIENAIDKKDTKSWETIRDTLGQKPIDKVQMETISSKTIEEVENYADKFRE